MSKESRAEEVNQRIVDRSNDLVKACRDRDVEVVKELLNMGDVDVNWQGHDHWNLASKTPLMVAAENYSTEIVRLLLNHNRGKVDVDLQNRNGDTALIYGCHNAEIVELILDKKPNLDIQNNDGDTALTKACLQSSSSKSVAKLLVAGAQVNLQNNKKQSALMIAAEDANIENVQNILKYHANTNLQDSEGRTALILACQAGCDAGRYHRNVHEYARPMMVRVIDGNVLKISKVLIEVGADINICDNEKKTALMHSCRYINTGESDHKLYKAFLPKEVELTEFLLKSGANIHLRDDAGRTALMIATQNRNTQCVTTLLDNGANEFDLKKLDPEFKYLTDQQDSRNISCKRSQWSPLANAIVKSVKNKNLGENKYPYAVVNKDNSVSFFTSNQRREIVSLATDYNADLREVVSQDWVAEQLEYQVKEMRLEKVGSGKLIETVSHAAVDVTEYKFNLSPTSLDSILKLNPQYTGYKNSGSVLKLVKDFSPKKGVIRLFPVVPINEERQEFFVQAAGCQVFEMPTVQLLRLLPNYQEEILPQHKKTGDYFHWVPKEVNGALLLGRSEVGEVLQNILFNNGITVTEGTSKTFHENPDYLKITDESKQSAVNIVAMDEDAKNFYQLYGNCSAQELDNCLSVEVRTIDLLREIGRNLDEKVVNNSSAQAAVSRAKITIQKMIEKEVTLESEEELKLGELELQNPHATSLCHPELAVGKGGGYRTIS